MYDGCCTTLFALVLSIGPCFRVLDDGNGDVEAREEANLLVLEDACLEDRGVEVKGNAREKELSRGWCFCWWFADERQERELKDIRKRRKMEVREEEAMFGSFLFFPGQGIGAGVKRDGGRGSDFKGGLGRVGRMRWMSVKRGGLVGIYMVL